MRGGRFSLAYLPLVGGYSLRPWWIFRTFYQRPRYILLLHVSYSHCTNSISIAYGIAYSRAPINMRGLVSAINLFNTGFAYIVNLAASAAIADPHLVWDFAAPAILGAIVTVGFVCFDMLYSPSYWTKTIVLMLL